MIGWQEFLQEIAKVCLLTGQNPSKEQMQAIFERIKDSNPQDFRTACEDDELIKSWSHRVNLPALKDAIIKERTKRLEKTVRERKEREREETKRFWLMKSSTECKYDRECYKCPVVYCDIVAARAIEGIKEILSGKKTEIDVNTQLAKEFKGIGLYDETEPF